MKPSFESSSLLPGLLYYDEFISASTEHSILSALQSHSKNWKILKNRTLQNWGGLPHAKGMLPTPLPPFLHPICEQLVSTSVFPSDEPPNHVLINRYAPGQGIDRHVDGPAYKPTAAIVSLQAPIVMDFYRFDQAEHALKDDCAPTASLLLRPRSLVVMAGDVYHAFYHAIAERLNDVLDASVLNCREDEVGSVMQRQERTSLTIRRSCRTIKNPLLGRSSR